MERDRSLERDLLDQAGGTANYPREVTARLDRFEENDGGNLVGWEGDVDLVLAEAQEEAADISGWLIGAVPKIAPAHRAQVIEAMRHAAAAHSVIEDLRLDLVLDRQREHP
jgi:hypothetical protein